MADQKRVLRVLRQGDLDAIVAIDAFATGEPRLSEIVQNYKAMGFEVHVEEFKAEGEGCNTCFDAGQEMGFSYGTVYVRKRGEATGEDELF